MYALVDCNNFYVSCERFFQPQYENKPVVVLSNNDGCVISRSEEAKALKIPMGAPEFQFRELFAVHNVKVFSSNYALYGDLSQRVMEVLKDFTPAIEVYSIDEAFLKFDDFYQRDYTDCGLEIKKKVQKWVGLPVCIGFAPTKALSKIANRIAKKFKERTNGVYVIDSEEKRVKALKWTKIEDVWGIGRRLSKKLTALGIVTALDFVQPQHEKTIKQLMGVVGDRLRLELLGISVLELDFFSEAKKNIAITRSFEHSIVAFSELKERISTFATIASEKLRKQKSCCYGISVFLLKKCSIEERRKSYFTVYKTIPFATQSALTLSQKAIEVLEEIYIEGESYTKAGVILTLIVPQNQKQFDLFEEENPKHEKLMKVMDAIRLKMGDRKLKIANQDMNRTWKMKQNHLSNRYTTQIDEMLILKC
ncbi:Y-family DNA polymerase [Flavobacterium amnicola]|uniref:Y-family DNA polymerase n=2 Tax=Flavobacterium amnicola TaxID=2506422 RepID=A0A4Q1K2W2_9FLAO|nr:Y-family DNA polymerase [Flavobacterium amnicola]